MSDSMNPKPPRKPKQKADGTKGWVWSLVDRGIIRKLKIESLQRNISMGEIIEQMLESGLKSKSIKKIEDKKVE